MELVGRGAGRDGCCWQRHPVHGVVVGSSAIGTVPEVSEVSVISSKDRVGRWEGECHLNQRPYQDIKSSLISTTP